MLFNVARVFARVECDFHVSYCMHINKGWRILCLKTAKPS
jgi:hypothetical protein